jgi:YVTN family beta-propeller protein
MILARRLIILSICVTASLRAAQLPSPALLIVIRGAGEHALAIADPQTMKIVGSVPIVGGGYPHEVAVSDDGRFAFVTNTSYGEAPPLENPTGMPGDFISVIDLHARKEVRHIEIGPESWPHGILSAGGKVYYSAEGYKLLGRYDPTRDRIDWMLGTDQSRQHEFVVSKDLKRIFAANRGSNSVSAIEQLPSEIASRRIPSRTTATGVSHPPDSWHVTVIPVPNGPEGIAMSPSEKEAWVLTADNGGLAIVDTVTKTVRETLDLKADDPIRLKFTPDGKRVLIVDGEGGDVLILDAVTRREIKRINLGAKMHGVIVAPDNSRAYVSVLGAKHVAIIDLNTLMVTGRIETGSRPEGMAWIEAK